MAPNTYLESIYASDVMFSMTDVRNVAESVFQAATRYGLHGKNYLVANESYKISDISRMLNNEPPLADATHIYSNTLAKTKLGVAFITARETLNQYF